MEVLRTPRGLIVDLITPLDGRGGIDGRGLGKHLDRVLPHVQGLLLAGPYMGEGRNLHIDQREELLEKSIVVVRERVPIFIWITGETEEATREILDHLQKRLKKRNYGGPVVWVDTPLYYHSNRGLPRHYRDLSTTDERPILLHNDPELIRHLERPLKRSNLRTGILKELVLMNTIQGLIFSGSLDRVYNYQKAARARNHFRIYDGDESRFLEHPSLSGIVSSGANLVPRAWQKITSSSLNLKNHEKQYPDSLQQIWKMGEFLTELKDTYRENPIPLIKQCLMEIGVIENSACSFDAGDREDIKEKTTILKDILAQQREGKCCGTPLIN